MTLHVTFTSLGGGFFSSFGGGFFSSFGGGFFSSFGAGFGFLKSAGNDGTDSPHDTTPSFLLSQSHPSGHLGGLLRKRAGFGGPPAGRAEVRP